MRFEEAKFEVAGGDGGIYRAEGERKLSLYVCAFDLVYNIYLLTVCDYDTLQVFKNSTLYIFPN